MGRAMRHALLTLAIASAILAAPAVAQDQDAMMRWGEATLDKLERFLPNARPLGFTPELPNTASDFKAFANDTPHRYPALVTHKTWYFPDPQLYHDIDQVEKDKAAFREQENAATEEFWRAHGDEMKALEKAHNAELNAATKQAQVLFQQGKYEEGKAVIQKVKPVSYAPWEALNASLTKKQDELYDREKDLLSRRRTVSFRIYTNRTPTTTAYAYPTKPVGTLVGRTLYRQVQANNPWVNLAIFLGPANFQNARVKLEERQPQVKCIVVWAWIFSHPDTLAADEEAAKKVLATIDYNGLSKLIEP